MALICNNRILLYIMSEFISINGVLHSYEKYKSADLFKKLNDKGLFETMFLKNGRIRLPDFHFDRLLRGLQILDFPEFKKLKISELKRDILEVVNKNNCSVAARVRLIVAPDVQRQDGYTSLVVCNKLGQEVLQLKNLVIGLYLDEKKPVDQTSQFKLCKRELYNSAMLQAQQRGLDECLIFNQYNRICDATISNIFLIKGNSVFTPPVSEGCVAGVMRRFLIEHAPIAGFEFHEQPVDLNDLESADEIFLTNAIRMIRPVKQMNNRAYSDVRTKKIVKELNALLNEES